MIPDNRGNIWTKEEYRQLADLFDSGSSLIEICRVMGRTPHAIVAKLQALNRLVNGDRNYHKVDPDPWLTWQAVVVLDEQFKEELSASRYP